MQAVLRLFACSFFLLSLPAAGAKHKIVPSDDLTLQQPRVASALNDSLKHQQTYDYGLHHELGANATAASGAPHQNPELRQTGADLDPELAMRFVSDATGIEVDALITMLRQHPFRRAGRGKGWRSSSQPHGPLYFFRSASSARWCLLAASTVVFYAMCCWLNLRRPDCTKLTILLWGSMACLYLLFIGATWGSAVTLDWIAGYMLELIFSLENIFIFHLIVASMGCSRPQMQVALLAVVAGQIIFEFIFFVGLAGWLRSLRILPYLLGLWLLFVGFNAAREAVHEDYQSDVEPKEALPAEDQEKNAAGGTAAVAEKDNHSFMQTVSWYLGSRLSTEKSEDCTVFRIEDGYTKVTWFGVTLFTLLLADFSLEVDVTLTKIEELDNAYITFSSSVMAAFMMPPIFFVGQELLQRYHLLKYGISLVVIILGLQQLLHTVVTISAMVDCLVLASVIGLCILISEVARLMEPRGKALLNLPGHLV